MVQMHTKSISWCSRMSVMASQSNGHSTGFFFQTYCLINNAENIECVVLFLLPKQESSKLRLPAIDVVCQHVDSPDKGTEMRKTFRCYDIVMELGLSAVAYLKFITNKQCLEVKIDPCEHKSFALESSVGGSSCVLKTKPSPLKRSVISVFRVQNHNLFMALGRFSVFTHFVLAGKDSWQMGFVPSV